MSDDYLKMIEEAQKQALEMQRKMMEASGMSPEDMNNFLSGSFGGNPESQENIMEAMFSGLMDNGEEKEEFVNSHPQPEEYARYLAIGSFLINMNDEPFRTLELMGDKEDFVESMEESWGIEDRESAMEMIESLLNGRSYNKVNATFTAIKSGNFDDLDEDELEDYQDTVEALHDSLGLTLKDINKCPSTIGWDIERVGHLARVCSHIGYITQDEAWQYLVRAGKLTKEHFTNWMDYAVSISMGRAFTMGYHPGYFYSFQELLMDDPEYLNSIAIESF